MDGDIPAGLHVVFNASLRADGELAFNFGIVINLKFHRLFFLVLPHVNCESKAARNTPKSN